MSIIAPMEQQGPYIPFEKPVPVPVSHVLETPLLSVCFNETWLPAVIGALKTLCRPETWIGSSADVKATWQDAHNLLASTSSGCGGSDCSPVFLGTTTQFEDCDPTPYYEIDVKLCKGCDNRPRVFVFNVQLDLLGSIASQQLQFLDWETGLQAGIHVCQFEGVQSDTTIGNVWNFTWLDCLGNTNQEQQIGTHFIKSNFDMQAWCLSSLAPFANVISVDGPILCGVA